MTEYYDKTNENMVIVSNLNERLKNAVLPQDVQKLQTNSLIYKVKMAKMNFIFYISKKQHNFMKLGRYLDYKGYKSYETRDEWGKVTAQRGIPRDEVDAKEKAFIAAKIINKSIQNGFLTENDINDSSFRYVIHRIKILEPKLEDWSNAVAGIVKENKGNSTIKEYTNPLKNKGKYY
ncbi:MAG: hypothetical protein IJ099_04015 [Alphaproteobacteria bacterium]|nr:hypothetical protein [Alphaproteobacteria bacterium]